MLNSKTKKMIATATLAAFMATGITPAAMASATSNNLDEMMGAKSTATFQDVPRNHWAYGVIDRAYQDGAIGGMTFNETTGVRTYEPEGKITLAQFSNILARSFYADELKNSTATGAWYAAPKEVLHSHHLYENVYSVLNFDWNLTRCDMAVMMANLLKDKGVVMPSENELAAAEKSIPDFNTIKASTDKEAVRIVVALGLIGGMDDKGTFKGSDTMTRAQAAAIYGRLKDKVNQSGTSTTPSKPVVEQPTTTPTEPEKPSTPVEQQKPVEPTTPTHPTESSGTLKTGYLTNGKPITEANIQEILEQLKEEYPDRTPWDENTEYNSATVPIGHIFGGCAAYAWMISDRIFGYKANINPLRRHQNFDQMKVGDILWAKNTLNHYEHVLVITSVEKDIDFFHACSGNTSGKVSWNGYGVISELGSETYLYTRY